MKAVAKAITWRLIGAVDTFLVAAVTTFVATGTANLAVATGVVGFEIVTKTVLYYFHERVWEWKALTKMFAKAA